MNDIQKTKGHKGQMQTRRISSKTINICGIYSSLEEAFEFCWSSLADEHNNLPKSTRRHVKLDKFVFGTLWLPDLLCKHWFASSVWNFCCWVADVPPRVTSTAAKSEEKRMFSQARKEALRLASVTYTWPVIKWHFRDKSPELQENPPLLVAGEIQLYWSVTFSIKPFISFRNKSHLV